MIPDGTIASAGDNDGVKSRLNFSDLNTPSGGWKTTAASAGQSVNLTWVATAPHDPSFFHVFLTTPGYVVTTQQLNWSALEDLGRWSVASASKPVTVGPGLNPISGGSGKLYQFAVPIPANRSGRETMVVVRQRQDPAGEAFVSVSDFQITAVPVPAPLVGGPVVVLGMMVLLRRM